MTDDPLLSVRDLETRFRTDDGVVRAVDGVSFDVRRGETVSIVGESGSGKTVTAETITRLLRSPPAEIAGGEVVFDGRNVLEMDDDELRALRGGRIGYVFQNPQGALNPVYTVGWQIAEAVRLHGDVDGAPARQRAIDLLDRVGIPEAATRVDDYPHEFSGGMKQRVAIAMALAPDPDLLVADEPTTALDVTIQNQILRLLDDLQDDVGTSVLLITHDLGVVAEVADRVVVMYAGKVMERAGVIDLFERPGHPYTRALLDCLPGRGHELASIGGDIPSATDPPDGCRFHPRCPYDVPDCRSGDQPPLHPVDGDPDHDVSCVHFGPGGDPDVRAELRASREATGAEATVAVDATTDDRPDADANPPTDATGNADTDPNGDATADADPDTTSDTTADADPGGDGR